MVQGTGENQLVSITETIKGKGNMNSISRLSSHHPSDILDRDAPGSILVEDFSDDGPLCPCPPSRRGVRKGIQKRLPITKWLFRYNLECLLCDIIAGLTVGLTVIPQGLAYAAIANLPVQYGLYSAFMGCFVYLFVGQVKDLNVGPNAILCLLVGQYITFQRFGEQYVDYAVLLCFLTGIVELILGLCKLGFLINFISTPVTSGFASAAAITISVSQFKALFGLNSVVHGHGFLEVIQEVFAHFSETHMWDLLMAFVSIVILLFLRKMKMWDLSKVIKGQRTLKVLNKTVWFVCTARNAFVILLGGLVAFFVNGDDQKKPLSLTGNVVSGIPPVAIPPFYTTNNGTETNLMEMVSNLGTSIIVIPFVGILETIAIAKIFARGKAIDFNQEIIAVGLCNVAGSFFSSMPTTGSFCRTVINAASGVKTQAGGIITGALVLLALGLLTPYFFYIPKASLAAVIICAVVFIFEYEELIKIWKTNKIDLIPWFACFLPCLLVGMQYGIMSGVAIDIILVLFGIARPRVVAQKRQLEGHNYLVIKPEGPITFAGTELVRNATIKKSGKNLDVPVIMDCEKMSAVDFTSVKAMETILSDLSERGQELVFVHADNQVKKVLQSGLKSNFRCFDTYSDWISATYTPKLSSMRRKPMRSISRMISIRGETLVEPIDYKAFFHNDPLSEDSSHK